MIAFFREILSPYKKLLFWIVTLQILSNCLSLYLPRISANILNIGVPRLDIPYITSQGGIMLWLSALQLVCAVAAGAIGARAALSASRTLRERLYAKILSLSQKEMAMFGAPTLITRATNDVQQVTQFVTVLFTVIISAPIMFIGGIVMALMLDAELSVMIFCTLPIFVLIAVWFVRRVVPYYQQQQQQIDRANGVMRDQISGVRVAKAFVKEKWERHRAGMVNGKLSWINLSIGNTSALMTPLFMLVLNFAGIGIMWLGGLQGQEGDVQMGTIISMVTYATFILSGLMSASTLFYLGPRADVSVRRIQEVLDTEPSIADKKDARRGPAEGDVRFENVSFSFAPDNPRVAPVLRNISFEAKPGETTAIIGSTGAGKTTLLNLIMRLMDVTQGTVKVDGVDVRDLSIDDLKAAIGLVPQKAFLFSGTLEENLRHARADATDEELWEALRIAQAEDFVRADPAGLKMRVAEGGANFSGGQRQRLAIARAIVRRPSIYIFDDSFSALDYATDKKLRGELKQVTGDSTVIVVAQRISSIRDANQIIVLNNGEIEAIGTHEELLAASPTYQEIAASQPADDKEGAA